MAKKLNLFEHTIPDANPSTPEIHDDAASPATTEAMKPIQFRVPEAVFAEFSEQAGREFGFSKGAKSRLFLKMWASYQAQREK